MVLSKINPIIYLILVLTLQKHKNKGLEEGANDLKPLDQKGGDRWETTTTQPTMDIISHVFTFVNKEK